MISAPDAVAILDRLAAAGVRCWLDGGWAVDAALAQQTRQHDDLDLVVALDDLPALRAALAADGFVMFSDELPTSCALRDPADRRVDAHPVRFDAGGGGLQAQPDGSDFRYPPEGFAGRGVIAGRAFPCLTPAVQVLCHSGYEPDDDDRRDVRALCERFALPPPAAYR